MDNLAWIILKSMHLVFFVILDIGVSSIRGNKLFKLN